MGGMEERIQKILAQAGLGSRRDCEEYIIAGRVRVNGTVAEIGQKADPATDGITLDGRLIKPAEEKIYIALHKPKYVLSTVDAEKGDTRQTVRDLVPVSERLYPVGRLDFESEGLVLMTNDGELAQKLTHPSHGHSKEYRVLLARQPDSEQLATWQRGVVLEDGYKTQKADIRIESLAGKGAWMRIVMREGRKRQIREIGAMLGLPVVRIVRIRIGTLLLADLKPAEWRYLTPVEIKALKEDRPGLAPFPDMTRKNPLKTRSKPVRKAPGRTPPPGRTAPPDNNGKAPVRTRPSASVGRTSGRRSERPEGAETPSRSTRPPGSAGRIPGQPSERPDGAKKSSRRSTPNGNAGTALNRPRPSGSAGSPTSRSTQRPESTGKLPGHPRPAGSAGKPAGSRKPAVRRPK